MEERKSIFAFLEEVLIEFGVSIITLCVLCLIFGEDAKGISMLFQLEDKGLAISIIFQFLLLSVLMATIRGAFFTDIFFHNMSEVWRTIWMLVSIVLVIAVFVFAFDWFPINMWEPWGMFFLFFGVFFFASIMVVHGKEKMENKRMEKALERLKKREEIRSKAANTDNNVSESKKE